ncbi:hypothetical protein BGZ95_007995, partial [Linnemannia exigua]
MGPTRPSTKKPKAQTQSQTSSTPVVNLNEEESRQNNAAKPTTFPELDISDSEASVHHDPSAAVLDQADNGLEPMDIDSD